MSDQSDNKRITVERTIHAASDAVFDVLSNPARHVEIDGSGFVRSRREDGPDPGHRRGVPDEHGR